MMSSAVLLLLTGARGGELWPRAQHLNRQRVQLLLLCIVTRARLVGQVTANFGSKPWLTDVAAIQTEARRVVEDQVAAVALREARKVTSPRATRTSIHTHSLRGGKHAAPLRWPQPLGHSPRGIGREV